MTTRFSLIWVIFIIVQWSSFHSSPRVEIHLEVGLDPIEQEESAEGTSSKYVERLVLQSSHARTPPALDDDPVDLTEPRFESFRLLNLKLPWCCIIFVGFRMMGHPMELLSCVSYFKTIPFIYHYIEECSGLENFIVL